MNKEKRLLKNTAIISIGRICTQCMSFFLLPLYTSILSTSEYGLVDLLVSYSSLLLPIVTVAIEQALFRFLIDVRSDETQKEIIISTTILFSGIQCIVYTVILTIIRFFIQSDYMLAFILMTLACTLSATMLQLSRGLGDNVGYALGSFITAVVQILCNVLFLVVFRLGANGMLLATFVGNTVCIILLFTKIKAYKYIKFEAFRKEKLKEMLKYSLPLVPNQLSWWTINASDKTIVAIFLGTASNGLLAVSHKFPNIYMQFSNIFNISWAESASLHISDEDVEEFFSKIINSVFRLFSCACVGIIVCIPFVFNRLVSDDYFDAYYQIPIFMLASLGNVVVSLYGVIYVANKKTKEIAVTAFYVAIINAGTHLLLINFIGLYAASISSLIGYWAMATYRYFHSRKYLVIKLPKKLLFMILIMMIIAFTSYYMGNFIIHILAFWIILLMSIWVNKKMLISALNTGKNMFLKAKIRK